MKDMDKLATTLHTLLSSHIVSFTYRKVNGTIRHAKGTRNLALVETYTGISVPTPKGKEQPNSYFDIEKMGWRSYKPENLMRIDRISVSTDIAKSEEIPVHIHGTDKTITGKKLGEPIRTELPIGNGKSIPVSMIPVDFGGLDLGKEIRKSMDDLDKDIVIGAPAHSPKVGTPTATEKGIALPLNEISVEDFAKLVAHYVVDELVSRLTR